MKTAKLPKNTRNGNGHVEASTDSSPKIEIPINLKALDIRTIEIKLVGDSPLVVHAWSEKAKQIMGGKQSGEARQPKQPKIPVECFKETLYRLPDGNGFGFPATGFKTAAVDAANSADLKKTNCRGAFFVVGDLVKIDAPPVTEPLTEWDSKYWNETKEERKHGASMRQDMVRVGMGVADLRYRAQFVNWSAKIQVRYNASVITPEQIVNLFNIAGFSVGIGEGRPQCGLAWGMFHVE